METKFTKGEWYAVKQIESMEVHSRRFTAGIDVICSINNQFLKEQTEANAKLIAAAPELLDSLLELISWIKEGDYDQSFIEKAEQAIKKATE